MRTLPRLLLLPALAMILAACSTGDTSREVRTVVVSMSDEMRYDPAEFDFFVGETVRFEVTNAGSLRHEFFVSDVAGHEEHAAEMSGGGHGSMGADEPGLVSVEPGDTESLEYTFQAAGELMAACHEPGHYEAGMVAPISVHPRS
ncbi:MAG TPA: plastocyanin/azurin family copper-binding protein [Candidatus Limnocylindria bacterium]|nr:plastocyanin/azurin family copper-binding protein [Candidatus Limnocylindria bacterium]